MYPQYDFLSIILFCSVLSTGRRSRKAEKMGRAGNEAPAEKESPEDEATEGQSSLNCLSRSVIGLVMYVIETNSGCKS